MLKLNRIFICAAVLMVISLFIGYSNAQFTKCTRDYQKMGCFRKGNTEMTEIVNDRSESSSVFSGHRLSWKQFGESIHSLACRCAEKARKNGYTYFSIRYYAECWAGKKEDQLKSLQLNKNQDARDCIGPNFRTCKHEEDTECVGGSQTEYMYMLVNGNWGGWSNYRSCSKACGTGEQGRSRSCTKDPAYPNSAAFCPGSRTETRSCNDKPCPVNGGWSVWSKYGICTKMCGSGGQVRVRFCNNPTPLHGGSFCSGPRTETRACNVKPCPAQWGAWQEWAQCSRPCGGGTQERKRSCKIGDSCVGTGVETKSCNKATCLTCHWKAGHSGRGNKGRVVVPNINNKKACLTACLWKNKADPEISGVQFKATNPQTCYCVRGMKWLSNDVSSTSCLLQVSFSWGRK